jgi:hypothetical protein
MQQNKARQEYIDIGMHRNQIVGPLIDTHPALMLLLLLLLLLPYIDGIHVCSTI